MLETAAAAPYEPDGEVSAIGRGRGDLRCKALYASAEVEFVLFDRSCVVILLIDRGLDVFCVARCSRAAAVRRESAMRSRVAQDYRAMSMTD